MAGSVRRTVLLLFLTAVTVFVSCSKSSNPVNISNELEVDPFENMANGDVIPGQYIVVLKPILAKTSVAEVAVSLSAQYNLVTGFIYESALTGFSATVPDDQIQALRTDPRVAYVEEDKVIKLPPYQVETILQKSNAQTTPWGITRVSGGLSGVGKTAWIIDTGVDFTHPDLTVDQARSRNFVSTRKTANDDNGHGSHVAGTIAAKNNTTGVIGVAAGATVVAVKVLNRNGSGTTSGVIAGINYVGASGANGDVANMSLGGGASSSLDNAVVNASSQVKFCLAAGNESDNANNHSPARANGPNIYTISAFAQGDGFASFSNYGNPPIDFSEPGVSVYSTYKNGGYATLSGTSMATPHASGLLLLGTIRNGGTVTGDPDGNPDVIGIH